MTQCLGIALDSWGFGFCVFLLLCAIMWEFHIYSQKCVALFELDVENVEHCCKPLH